MDCGKIWNDIQEAVKTSVGNEVGYSVHIKKAEAVHFGDSLFTVAVPNPINKNMIDFRFKDKIESVLEARTGQKITLNVIMEEEKEDFLRLAKSGSPVEAASKKAACDSNLNPKYTFENFVIGSSNAYAASAAISTSENPGHIYNPLFLYGNSGLGKTHLMCAIGNRIKEDNPNAKIMYQQTEAFTNEFVECIKSNKMDVFRRKFRTVDALLVDDVQFLENREGFQEEFFHTFNELSGKNKQIVLTSDKKPGELTGVEERLITRFSQGLTIDVAVPDYETRLAILKKKTEINKYSIDYNILEYIADKIKSNVRELEGALLKLVSLSQLKRIDIDLDLAEYTINSILPKDGIVKITPDKIMDKVCAAYGVTKDELLGKSRIRHLVVPRQVAMYLCSKLTDMNSNTIGRAFHKDRSTVMHGIEKIEKDRLTDESLKSNIDYIIKDLQSV